MTDLITEREAAAALAVHPKTLARLRREGRAPPHVLVGDRVRYRSEDVDAWVVSQQVTADPTEPRPPRPQEPHHE